MSRLAARAAVTTSWTRGKSGGEGVDGDGTGEDLVDGLPQGGAVGLADAIFEPETLGETGAGCDGRRAAHWLTPLGRSDVLMVRLTCVVVSHEGTLCRVDPPTPLLLPFARVGLHGSAEEIPPAFFTDLPASRPSQRSS
ncbi:hypothetical protein GCM10020001_045970 [Nonomuraea salmonea]